jgi:hypothetical protein
MAKQEEMTLSEAFSQVARAIRSCAPKDASQESLHDTLAAASIEIRRCSRASRRESRPTSEEKPTS